MEWSQLESDSGIDPVQYVLSRNLHRRHLTTGQRAAVAAKMAKVKRGRPIAEEKGPKDPFIEEAAAALNVSPKSVKRGKTVIEHGSQELIDAVETGGAKAW
jgi:hypothetical protein